MLLSYFTCLKRSKEHRIIMYPMQLSKYISSLITSCLARKKTNNQLILQLLRHLSTSHQRYGEQDQPYSSKPLNNRNVINVTFTAPRKIHSILKNPKAKISLESVRNSVWKLWAIVYWTDQLTGGLLQVIRTAGVLPLQSPFTTSGGYCGPILTPDPQGGTGTNINKQNCYKR